MRITQRQLRQIIKEELSRVMNEEDTEMSAMSPVGPAAGSSMRASDTTSTKYGGYDIGMASDAERFIDRFDSILSVVNQDVRDLLDTPAVRNELAKVIEGKKTIKMGSRGPAVSVIKMLVGSALSDIRDSIKSADYKGSVSVDFKGTVTKLLTQGASAVNLATLKAACAGAMQAVEFQGDTIPSGDFNDRTADAVVLYQFLAGLNRPDAVVGKETIAALAKANQSFKLLSSPAAL